MSDFCDTIDIAGIFSPIELDEGVDFADSGDVGGIIISGGGFGAGGFGEGPFGIGTVVILNSPTTLWTNTDAPASALILRSPDSTRWSVVILPTGNLDTNVAISGPSGYYDPGNFYLRDTNGVNWIITIDNTGHLVTTSGGDCRFTFHRLYLQDSNNKSWYLIVSTLGNLTTI